MWRKLFVASAAGVLSACAAEDNFAVGVDAACTRTSDCQAGLFCAGGVCTPAASATEAGAEGGAGRNDAGAD